MTFLGSNQDPEPDLDSDDLIGSGKKVRIRHWHPFLPPLPSPDLRGGSCWC